MRRPRVLRTFDTGPSDPPAHGRWTMNPIPYATLAWLAFSIVVGWLVAALIL
jgi:hypothetical protein